MRKILLVEDEEPLREAYMFILSTQPYDLDVAANGKVALDKTRHKTYDLILLDLMMPIMDGIGFLKRFAFDSAPHTKIIILSNLSSGKELNETIELGAHKTILKADLTPKQVIATVRYELDA
jgi:DNA-binding response OmpR family regulator